jgi:hypothetical protein
MSVSRMKELIFNDRTENTAGFRPEKKSISSSLSGGPHDNSQPALVQFSSTPLFRVEKCPDKYAHLLKKRDMEYVIPIVNYFINHSGHVAYLGGEVVKNLYLRGRKEYRSVNILAILSGDELYKYSSVMNNIISSNDGAFSLGMRYRVRKNRGEGSFRDVAIARYILEARFEGIEKLLFPFRPSPIELDLTTREKFYQYFGLEAG